MKYFQDVAQNNYSLQLVEKSVENVHILGTLYLIDMTFEGLLVDKEPSV